MTTASKRLAANGCQNLRKKPPTLRGWVEPCEFGRFEVLDHLYEKLGVSATSELAEYITFVLWRSELAASLWYLVLRAPDDSHTFYAAICCPRAVSWMIVFMCR